MDLGAALAGRAARGGACVRTGRGADLYSAPWRRSSDPATECKRKSARHPAPSNNGCANHRLREGSEIRKTREQLRAERGGDRPFPARETRRGWLEFAQIKERSGDRKHRCSRDTGRRSFCFRSGRSCGGGGGRCLWRDRVRIAVEWPEFHESAAALDARRRKGRGVTK